MGEYKMQKNGFTLIELMISLIIGIFMLGGVMFTYISMKTTTTSTLEIAQLQDSAQLAMDILTKDIELAGFWGTYYGASLDAMNVTAPDNPTDDCTTATNGSGSGSFPKVGTAYQYIYSEIAGSTNALGCIDNTVVNSDIIQIKRMSGRSLSAAETNSDNFYFLSEYGKGAISQGPIPNFRVARPNGTLWAFKNHIYFIELLDVIENGRSIEVPTLMRRRLTTEGFTDDVIMEGVENMRFLYGVDTTFNNRVDTYRTAEQMSSVAWDISQAPILTVQLFLLVRAFNEDPNLSNTGRTYTLGGEGTTSRELTFEDRFRRTLIVSTIKILNGGVNKWRVN